MTIHERVKDLNERRLRTWERGKEILDEAARQGRGLTGEERANFDRTSDEITRLDRERDDLVGSDEAKREREFLHEEFRRVASPDERRATERLSPLDESWRRGSRTTAVNVDLRAAAYTSNAYRAGCNRLRVPCHRRR